MVGRLRAAGLPTAAPLFSYDLFRETRPPRLELVAPGAKHYQEGPDFLTYRYSGSGSPTTQVVPVEPASPSSGGEASQ